MSRNRRTHIVFRIFSGYTVTVIEARSIVETGKRLGVDLKGCAACWIGIPNDPMHCYLVFGTCATPMDIAHEASHAIEGMFRTVGVSTEADETFAYHIGYLVSRIDKFLGRKL